jgi:hypothetical protein
MHITKELNERLARVGPRTPRPSGGSGRGRPALIPRGQPWRDAAKELTAARR